jgi:hypothetical protein
MTDQDVLSTAYRDVVAAVSDLDADQEWLPTGCALVVALDRPLPSAGPMRMVRENLDGLLGELLPLPWDDVAYARTGTGRAAPSEQDRAVLGPLAERFPLFG